MLPTGVKIFITMLALIIGKPASAAIFVVTNLNNPLTTITKEDLRKIYLGKTRTFSNNLPAVPVDQESDSAASAEFLAKVIEKNAKEIKAYWSIKIFTGRGTPPAQLASDSAVKQWLGKNPDGLGYITDKSLDTSVKVLLSIP